MPGDGSAPTAGALDRLAAKLQEDFPSTGNTPGEVFTVYARDHGREPRT